MSKYKLLSLALLMSGFLVSMLCQTGCGVRDQRQVVFKMVGKTVLRPYFTAIRDQDWGKVQQYLSDDVHMTVKDQHIIGKAPVIEWLKTSPARKFSDFQESSEGLEALFDRVTVKIYLVGKSKEGAVLSISLKVVVIHKDNYWLIHDLIYDTFELS